MPPSSPAIVSHAAARFVDLGSLGVRFLLDATHTGGSLSVVEHPVPPRTLAAPLHRHGREDEYSVVLEGTLTVQLGDAVHEARVGDVVCKPRGQWHTFWNAGDGPCRILEIITPAGFEGMFARIADDPTAMTGDAAAALDAAYGIDVDYDSIERLCRTHGLDFPA
jgi:quercetin dioxygenase-like cupin family protein